VLLVVEGRARGVPPVDGVRVFAASGSGDDAIVELLEREPAGRVRVVVTADRGLRERVTRLGATVLGPRALDPASGR
jgi:rRNA-processing protein FCF1